MKNVSLPKISLNITHKILIVSIQIELQDEAVEQLQQKILDLVYDKQLKGVLIDVSGIDIIDSFMTRKLTDIAKAAKLLGARTLFTGIRPEIVASLVDLGNIAHEIAIVLNVDEGLRILNTPEVADI